MFIWQSIRDAMHRSPRDAFHTPLRLEGPDGTSFALRTMTAEDELEWDAVRSRNVEWLDPWESNDPMRHELVSFSQWIAMQRREERDGSSIVLVMEFEGRIVGQISLGAVFRGAMRTGIIGYWIDEQYAGRGLTPLAVAMLCDWALLDADGPRLHRMEIDIVPENQRSRRVVQKVGAQYEGLRRQYMYIHGQWRDHESYSLVEQDAPGGFTRRLMGDTPSEPFHDLS
ncbi:MAG: GNAT family protein [Bifidobacterium sp.]|nr:GNAT family protein [Bifidobacterium sp.]